MREPVEVPDAEYEQLVARVAAIDVAKSSGTVCTRVPHETKPGGRVSKVWDVDATSRAVLELGDHLVGEGIEVVTVESTSDYWRIFFYVLEAGGLRVQLVNGRDVKNVPGRAKSGLPRVFRSPENAGQHIPAHRQTPRQAQSPRRRRPFHPGHHLQPAV